MEPVKIIQEYLKSNSFKGVILARKDNYRWLTKGSRNDILVTTEIGVAALVVTSDDLLLLADSSDCQRMKEEQNPLQARVAEVPWEKGLFAWLEDFVTDGSYAADCNISGTVNIHEDLIKLRLRLDENELTLYRKLGRQAAEIVEDITSQACCGDREEEIAVKIQTACLNNGISPDCILVGTDERMLKYRHPYPSGNSLKKYLMVVLGCQKYGLNISLTRMACVGPLPEEMRSRMEKVQYVFAGMQGLLKEGVTYREYFQGVKRLYEQAGYPDEWQRHHQGGPTGYACREFIITPKTPGTIETDCAFAWNPTIQGTKCEETTCLRKTGVEIFTDTGNWPRKRTETPYGSFDTALIKEL